MESKHLSQDEFFAKLGELFAQRKGASHGAVYLTQKRCEYQPLLTLGVESDGVDGNDAMADRHVGNSMPVIIRASNGKSKRNRSDKIKISTVVQPDDLGGFYARYADVCKSGMTALRPRDRSKKKAKARKKKTVS
ncbi:signal recognition particle domain-containing protein [Pochonia chlamydosporia 170]|uniref:Signal recognition particle subunit SRP14 n=1 Tax=Pochonia chlamydosporia 170 TaxID=1380566 RepID=A0A179FNK1_METCM|nr:signal recognition particle domain-containing protein [Pochonia chlamydosporia 170]OAQ66643.2 signal recognition particle domain-containing protein [Pochonia chlamydosporia 170]